MIYLYGTAWMTNNSLYPIVSITVSDNLRNYMGYFIFGGLWNNALCLAVC